MTVHRCPPPSSCPSLCRFPSRDFISMPLRPPGFPLFLHSVDLFPCLLPSFVSFPFAFSSNIFSPIVCLRLLPSVTPSSFHRHPLPSFIHLSSSSSVFIHIFSLLLCIYTYLLRVVAVLIFIFLSFSSTSASSPFSASFSSLCIIFNFTSSSSSPILSFLPVILVPVLQFLLRQWISCTTSRHICSILP